MAIKPRMLVASLAAGFLLPTMAIASPAAATDTRPTVGAPEAVHAPIGQPGGVINPFVGCNDSRLEPRVRWTISQPGFKRTYRWRGALPGVAFPRVDVGTYRSLIVARCHGKKVRQREKVTVRQKTRETTLSWSEFRAVKRGMTPQQVQTVTGLRGRAALHYGNTSARTYDNMSFWDYSSITFRDGRVIRKDWKFDHD